MTSIERREIAPSTARVLVTKALGHAEKNGWEVAVAVVDPHVYLVAFGRTDNVAPSIGEFALDKAYTSGVLRKSSKAFGERMASSATLSLGLGTRNRFMAWGGGVAILEGDVCIGGLGVSGAQESEDIACAEVAILDTGLSCG